MGFYFSKNTGGFYSQAIHGNTMPSDAVEITAEHYSELMRGQEDGLSITADDTGYPVLQSPPPVVMTASDIERLRLTAYADPISGSDRYFNEATRMQLMDEGGWETIKTAGIVRYQKIQQEYPWPADL